MLGIKNYDIFRSFFFLIEGVVQPQNVTAPKGLESRRGSYFIWNFDKFLSYEIKIKMFPKFSDENVKVLGLWSLITFSWRRSALIVTLNT